MSSATALRVPTVDHLSTLLAGQPLLAPSPWGHVNALRIVSQGVNQLINPDNAVILVTHYQRLLNYIVPDFVHVMEAGRIIKTGGKELALELEARGYDWVSAEHEAASNAEVIA